MTASFKMGKIDELTTNFSEVGQNDDSYQTKLVFLYKYKIGGPVSYWLSQSRIALWYPITGLYGVEISIKDDPCSMNHIDNDARVHIQNIWTRASLSIWNICFPIVIILTMSILITKSVLHKAKTFYFCNIISFCMRIWMNVL